MKTKWTIVFVFWLIAFLFFFSFNDLLGLLKVFMFQDKYKTFLFSFEY